MLPKHRCFRAQFRAAEAALGAEGFARPGTFTGVGEAACLVGTFDTATGLTSLFNPSSQPRLTAKLSATPMAAAMPAIIVQNAERLAAFAAAADSLAAPAAAASVALAIRASCSSPGVIPKYSDMSVSVNSRNPNMRQNEIILGDCRPLR